MKTHLKISKYCLRAAAAAAIGQPNPAFPPARPLYHLPQVCKWEGYSTWKCFEVP